MKTLSTLKAVDNWYKEKLIKLSLSHIVDEHFDDLELLRMDNGKDCTAKFLQHIEDEIFILGKISATKNARGY